MDEGLSRIFKTKDPREVLGTSIVGAKVLAFDMVTSTNDLAHFLAKNGEGEGVVIFANGQTQGRGRLGRSWISPKGAGLYFSIILRPSLMPAQASRVTLALACGIASALQELGFKNVRIKWPNDIQVEKKKVCGILTEMSLVNDRIDYLVAGVGVNVKPGSDQLGPEAISLEEVAGSPFDLSDLSHLFMKHLDHYYGLLLGHKFIHILEEAAYFTSWMTGLRAKIAMERGMIEGRVLGIDADAALLLRKDNGMTEKFFSGHVVSIA